MQFTAPEADRVETYIQDIKEEEEEKEILKVIEHVRCKDAFGARFPLNTADALRGQVVESERILRVVNRDTSDEEKVETLLLNFHTLTLSEVNRPERFDHYAAGRLGAYYDLFLNDVKWEF